MRAVGDRIIDHLAIDLHGGFTARLGLPESCDDALGARKLFRARHVRGIDRRDLVGMHAEPPLESAAAAAFQGARESLGFLEVKPWAVDRPFKRLDYAPALFFARAASHPRFIALLGQDAEFSLGAVDFDPRIGEPARSFAKAYIAKWTVPPGLAAAEGYAAGVVLAAAVRSARSLDQQKLRSALASLEVQTPFGGYKASPQNGAQVGAKPVVVQIRRGRPEPGDPLLPYPQWNERALIR